MKNDARCSLYLITPPRLDPASFAGALAAALDAGTVACVQLRLKNCSDDEIRRAADTLRPVAQDRDIAFLMNDRPDLAVETGCDGVHVGQEDPSYADARAIVGRDAIVGVTCGNSRHIAMTAAEHGADYVAFGAFYPSATKDRKTHATLDTLETWSTTMTVPCVAIGGITVDNCGPLVAAGADFLAVIAGVWDYPEGPAEAVKAFESAIAAVA